jgi:SAM-dependent methyltransferase
MASLHRRSLLVCAALTLLASAPVLAQDATQPFTPTEGQAGKDVVWVPTPAAMVERMLDVAKVTSQDIVMDLGSGDGRNIIAAAKRGARATGVEFNQDMVDLSKRLATEAGVGGANGKAQFIQGDMYVADISQASVMAIFLLPHNMEKLRDKFLALKPGSRIVSNTFAIPDWEADYTETMPDCTTSWCTILLWYVPAKVEGTWQTPQGALTLSQQYQRFSGSQGTTPVAEGRINGEQVTFMLGQNRVTAVVKGNVMEGTINANGKLTPWRATKTP